MSQRAEDSGAFFMDNPNPMWIYDPDTLEILEVNNSATELYDYTKRQMKSLTLKDLRPPEEVPALVDEVAKNLQTFSSAGSWKHQTSNGEIIYVRIFSYPINWDEKMCKIVVARDVTNEIKAEQKLNQTREQLQKIMNHSPAVICTMDKDGIFVQVSAAARTIWGYRPEELIGRNHIELVYEDDVELTQKQIGNLLEGTHVSDFENRCVKKDGSTATMKWSARWDSEDQLIYCVGIDASEIKEVQVELTRERNMLRSIIDNLPDYIYVKDKQRRLTVCNKSLYRDLLGFESEQQAIGKTSFDLFDNETAKPIDEDDRKVIETGQPVINSEETAYDHKGNRLDLLTTKLPRRDESDDIIGLVGITKDITWQKQATEQLRLSKEKYNLVAKATQDAIYDWDIKENRLFWDESFKTVFVHK